MDKATILAELKANGNIAKNTRTSTWEKAFDLYNKSVNDNLRPSCGSCFRKVLKWLQS